MQATLEHDVDADQTATLIAASRRYQIAVRDLQMGMFVAELDRPWLDTPFLLQGFLVDSQVELDTLRKYCQYVYADLELSLPQVAETIRRAEVRGASRAPARDAPVPGAQDPVGAAAAAEPAPGTDKPQPEATPVAGPRRGPSGRVYKARADVRISADTRQRFRQLVRASSGAPPRARDDGGGVLQRAASWVRGLLGGDDERARGPAREPGTREPVRAWLPPGIELTEHAEAHRLEQELPRARSSFAAGQQVLRDVVSDIKVGRIPQIDQVQAAVGDMVDSMVDNADALMWIARLRNEDVNTYNHGVQVALYLISLGRHLGFPKKDLAHLGMIGMLADIGKIKLPRALLEKPGMLAPSEFGLIKEHVRLGLEAIRAGAQIPPEVEQGIAQHHERLDGTGYPKGLKGQEISIYGRMTAIADSFAALITPRAYANPSAPQDALMNLYEWAGSSFHEPLVEQFVQAIGVFPVGSLVELSSGEVAVVVSHNRVRRLEPRVLVLTGADKVPLSEPRELDLFQQSRSAGVKPVRVLRGLPSGAYGLKIRDYYATDESAGDDRAG